MLAPFVASYCALDIAQDGLVYIADRPAHPRCRLGRGPLVEEAEVLGLVVRRRVVAAAGEQSVGGAGGRGADEARHQLVFIIARHQRAVNDSAEVVAVLVEVHLRELARSLLKLRGQPFALRAEVLLKPELHLSDVAVVNRPEPQRARISPRARVRDVENVPQPRRVARRVQERDPLSPAPHIPPHPPRPHVVIRAGRSLRPLGVDQHLVGEAVFVVARNRAEKRRPRLIAISDAA